MTVAGANVDRSDRLRIDDRGSYKGSRTPANLAMKAGNEFFNRIDPKQSFNARGSDVRPERSVATMRMQFWMEDASWHQDRSGPQQPPRRAPPVSPLLSDNLQRRTGTG
jgi:hypothetical protein